MNDLIRRLRDADEGTVHRALEYGVVSLPLESEADVLEAFNRMLDVILDKDEDSN